MGFRTRAEMKGSLVAGVAALLLATGAQAEEPRHQLSFDAFAENVWHFNDYKKCTARVEFTLPSTPNPKDWLLRADMPLGQFKELLGCLGRHRTSSGRTATVSHGSALPAY